MDQNFNDQKIRKDMLDTISGRECEYDERYGRINEPRTMEEIVGMANEFCDKIWYNRHFAVKYRIEHGMETVAPEIWTRALAEEERIRQKYGEGNLGPCDDFEWGMLNGKLSALRWVMGCEWDMLDT